MELPRFRTRPSIVQARLASTQEEVRSGSGGGASEAVRVARAQVGLGHGG